MRPAFTYISNLYDRCLPRLAWRGQDNRPIRTNCHIIFDPYPTEVRNIDAWLNARNHAFFQRTCGAGGQERNELMVSQAYTMPGDVDEVLPQSGLLKNLAGSLIRRLKGISRTHLLGRCLLRFEQVVVHFLLA